MGQYSYLCPLGWYYYFQILKNYGYSSTRSLIEVKQSKYSTTALSPWFKVVLEPFLFFWNGVQKLSVQNSTSTVQGGMDFTAVKRKSPDRVLVSAFS